MPHQSPPRWLQRPEDWSPLLDRIDDDGPRFTRTEQPVVLAYVFSPRGHRHARHNRIHRHAAPGRTHPADAA